MLIINFILFQISWFACVIGAARGYPLLGVSITIITLFWHLFQSKQPKFEFLLIVIVLMLGGLFDQFLLSMSLVNYQSNGWDSSFVPVWILALWTAFASTLNLSLSWMHDRYLISTLFGAIGGPLAFLGAQQLGALSLNKSISLIVISIGWAVITPLLLVLASKINATPLSQHSQES